MDFAVLVEHKVKIKENERIHKYLNLALKQLIEQEGNGDTNCN